MALVLIVAVALVGGAIWKLFFSESKPSQEVQVEAEKVNIDFSVLESEKLKDLKPFDKISSTTSKIGRNNPFRATSSPSEPIE